MNQRDRETLSLLCDQMVSKINLSTLLPKLLDNRVFNRDDVNIPKWKENLNDVRTITDVYHTIKTRGPQAYAGFILSLNQSQHGELGNMLQHPNSVRLNENNMNCHGNGNNSIFEGSKDDPTEYRDDYHSKIYNTNDPLIVKVRKAKTFLDGPHQHPHILRYCMRSKPRGLVLIINNMDYPGQTRKGAEQDEKNIKDLFKQMGFQVMSHRNLTGSEMREKIEEFSQMPELRNVDSSFVIVSSHGRENEQKENVTIKTENSSSAEILGVDYSRAGEQQLTLNDVIQYFEATKCPNLAGKPKIFILQACRGDRKQLSVSRTEADVAPLQQEKTDKKPTTLIDSLRITTPETIRNYQDIFTAYSTIPGHVSYRDIKNGSWFIQILVEVFMNHAHNTHLQDLFALVDDRLSTLRDFSSNCQTMKTENIGFSKHCYINPGLF